MTAAIAAEGIRPGAETIDMQDGNSHAVLLLHGFGDTPQTLRLLAENLHGHGLDVRAPLLPGHGTNVDEFTHSGRREWLASARNELDFLAASHSRVSVAGLSMGGAIGVILAAERRDVSSLVLIAPYLDMSFTQSVASASWWLWGPMAGVRKSSSPRSIVDPAERSKNLGYGVYSARLLYELWQLAREARLSLARVICPTLVIQSKDDPRIAPAVAERALAAINAREKNLMWVNGGHIITVDYDRDRVFGAVESWITAHDG